MNVEEAKSLIISDLLRIDDYRSSKEIGTSKGSDRYDDLSLEVLKQVYDVYIDFLLGYKTAGEPYPSIIELLKYPNDKIVECIQNYKYERKQQLRDQNIMRISFDHSKNKDEYCEACQQSPCMCSDREATSTVHDF